MAHCIRDDGYNFEPNDSYVLLGRHDISNSNESQWIKREFSATFIHDEYGTTKQKSLGDIAIMEMNEIVEFTDFIQPVCLPIGDENVSGIFGTIVGYGRNEFAQTYDTVPRYSQIMAINTVDCIFKHQNYWTIVSPKSFCAGSDVSVPCKGMNYSEF